MTRLPGCVVVVVLLCAASGAWADMPNYDVEAHCHKVAAFGGAPSQSVMNGCLHMEQSAYDHLKPVWDSLPKAMRDHCDQVATFGGPGSFSVLQGCIDMERNAQKQNEQFKFKR